MIGVSFFWSGREVTARRRRPPAWRRTAAPRGGRFWRETYAYSFVRGRCREPKKWSGSVGGHVIGHLIQPGQHLMGFAHAELVQPELAQSKLDAHDVPWHGPAHAHLD